MRAVAWRRWLARLDRVVAAAVAIVVVPVATAVWRAIASDWIPIGDNALVEIRARDVWSWEHLPLLGTWSSASLTAGTDLNHPGPLLFDLLAVPVAVFGGPAGVALGIGLLNAAMAALAVVVAHRVAGRGAALVAAAVSAALVWTLGSVLLTDPWNPHPLVLTCWAMLVLTWAVASGHHRLLAAVVAVASLSLQVHLGYAYLVPALVVTAVLGAVLHDVAQRRADAAAPTTGLRRNVLVAAGVGVLLWAQPLIEQFTSDGRGNLARIVTSAGGDAAAIGWSLAVRLVATVIVLPPWWGRSSFTESVVYTPYEPDGVTVRPDLVGAVPALFAVAALVAVLAVLGRAAARGGRRHLAALVVVDGVALAVAVASLAISPIGPLGLTPHQMRWLWAIGAFTAFTVVVTAAAEVAARWVRPPVFIRRLEVAAPMVATAVFAVLAVPFFAQPAGPATFQDQLPTARRLDAQLRAAPPVGPVRVIASDLRFTESYSTVVMSALIDAGVDVRVVEPGLVRQLGPARAADGTEVLEIRLAEGRAALDERPGTERIALAGPLSAAEIDELLAGEQVMIDTVTAGGVTVSTAGEAAIAAGQFGMTRDEVMAEMADASRFVIDGLAAEMMGAGALDVVEVDREVFRRTSELRRRVDVTTVAVYAQRLVSGSASSG